MTQRGHISLSMKLEALFALGMVRCGICKDPIETQAEAEWDHVWQLATDGPHAADNLRPVHDYCHKIKTKADAYARAKIRHLTGANKPKASRPIPSRGFDRTRTRTFGGQVVARERT